MSFQHFSTIFLSTTAGWWGWRGCWWGWKASFIKLMRPAPLRGFPAINSLDDRGLAPGFGVDNQGGGVLLDTLLNRAPAVSLGSSCRGCEQNKKLLCVRSRRRQRANKLHRKILCRLISNTKWRAGDKPKRYLVAFAAKERPVTSWWRWVKSPWVVNPACCRVGR